MLDPEDEKLLTLARAARQRTGAGEGAAVRDDIGRTYVAATVDRGPLRLSALELALASAISSGASGFEAAVVVGDGEPESADLASALGVPVLHVAGTSGELRETRPGKSG
jgi:hypothetical protein